MLNEFDQEFVCDTFRGIDVKCPKCDHVFDGHAGMQDPCQVEKCTNPADFEGYEKSGDMVRLKRVCNAHKTTLIGGQKSAAEKGEH